MAIWLTKDSKVIVQGVTGSEGSKHTRRMLKADPALIAKTIANEVAVYRELMRSPEAVEAFTAFLEKRPPDFAKARRQG